MTVRARSRMVDRRLERTHRDLCQPAPHHHIGRHRRRAPRRRFPVDAPHDVAPRRRQLGAVLGVAGAVSATNPAAAADGDALVLGTTNEPRRRRTSTTAATTVAAEHERAVRRSRRRPTTASSTVSSPTPAPRCSASPATATATRASASSRLEQRSHLGTGIVGFTGGAGGLRRRVLRWLGRRCALRPGGNQPIDLADTHQVGEMYEDATGTHSWLCTAAPGRFHGRGEGAGPSSTGAFHAIAPRRVDDSRRTSKLRCARRGPGPVGRPTRSTAPSTLSPAWRRPSP